ncbi:peptidase M16 domain protein [Oleidesulfovibrio alaskensis G20]|uniref:Peptidase M16 domain protein n=1 Tax=Oleidesulfovibrio alaskensis (strain ATCC BAA-1058 / DSM 17464 / G20) TaxID=207559 RepID=Q316A1_OLEA2|nr:insulinase family protein [Oleidesulfovibrio alaskensis]ABB37245.1 peptidase M16 domain protein [Oleidesulfovibrio alaskensis G20]MBG0772573.1 insulinase family protein [Oleidesulfovibrio alaskensis]
MRQLKMVPVLLLLMVAIGCVRTVAPQQPQGEAWWLDGLWPHEKSDLPQSDKAVFGRLDNGLRYIIMQNEKPEDRVTVQLNVQAGSLMERDDELGLAHFLEHMAFNGSTNFAPGELIPFFQENGLAFGRDANAHTSLLETVYKLNLSAEEANVEKGLLVMRDVADGLSILPEEVEKERGVILSEKAARDSKQYRAARRLTAQVYEGTRFVNDTIGSEEIIRTATAETIRGFYDAWYRPELMVLVVVGSVDPADVESDIKKLFGDLAAHGERRVLEPWGDVQREGVHGFYDNYDADFTVVRIGAMKPRRWADDSLDLQRRMALGAMANSIVSKRLQRLKAAGNAPFLNAFVREVDSMYLFPTADMIARTEAANWRETFAVLQDELRRTMKYGFLPEEVDEVRAELLRSYERRARFESQIANDDVASVMIGCFNGNRVYQSWQQTYDMYKTFFAGATAEELHRVFLDMWDSGNRMLFITGDAVIEGDAGEELRRLWKEGMQRPVAPLQSAAALDYPYVDEPAVPGEAASSVTRPVPGSDLVLHEVVFRNGLVLRMLPTPFMKDHSSLSLHVGGGSDALDDEEYVVAQFAVDADKRSGFGRLTAEEAGRLFRSTGYGASYNLGSESLQISGRGETADMRGILQAMWTQFRDPHIEEKDRQEKLRELAIADAARDKDVSSAAGTAGRRLFFGDSVRINPLTAQQGAGISLQQMRDALKKLYAGGGGVLNIVGDFDPEEARRLVAAYFGAPEVQWQPAAAPVHAFVPRFPAPDSRTEHVVVDAALNQAELRVGYLRRLQDPADRKTLAARRLLASVVRDRLRTEVREELGASYSPGLFYWADDVNGYGMYMVRIGTQPDKLDMLVSVVDDVMRDVAAGGVTAEEMERQRLPMLSGWEENRRENGLYIFALDAEARRPFPYFVWDVEYIRALRALTAEDLNREARAAFTEDSRAVLTVTESGTAPQASAE